jgi:acyl-CoA oxidase
VVIPKENMLDRFASINDKGEFESPIPSDNRRFFNARNFGWWQLDSKVCLAAAKSGLTIAIRYSDQRRQFGRRRIRSSNIIIVSINEDFPLLAKTYATFALYVTNRLLIKVNLKCQKLEALAAGMKRLIQLGHNCFTGMS